MNRLLSAVALLAISLPLFANPPTPQFTSFTYQGHLSRGGSPANGSFDMDFRLWDAETNGLPIGTPIHVSGYPVADGLFTIDLDFPGLFVGNQRWIEVTVAGEVLTPRQPVNSVPVAQLALQGSIVKTVTMAGSSGDFPGLAAAFTFATTTVTVETTMPNQTATGAASVTLATIAGTSSVDYGLCYQLGAGAITLFVGPTNFMTATATPTKTPFSTASSVVLPAAGTYTLGFCARNTGPNDLNNNDYVNGFFQIVN